MAKTNRSSKKLYHFLRNKKITSAQFIILFITTMLLYLYIHPFLFETTTEIPDAKN